MKPLAPVSCVAASFALISRGVVESAGQWQNGQGRVTCRKAFAGVNMRPDFSMLHNTRPVFPARVYR